MTLRKILIDIFAKRLRLLRTDTVFLRSQKRRAERKYAGETNHHAPPCAFRRLEFRIIMPIEQKCLKAIEKMQVQTLIPIKRSQKCLKGIKKSAFQTDIIS